MGAFEDGSSFVTGVLGKLPAELSAQVKAALDKPEAKDAVTLIGESVLARSDYSKKMDALNADITTQKTQLTTQFNELNAWYEKNQAALKEYPTLKAEYDRLKSDTPPDADDDKGKGGGLTKDEIQKLVDAQIAAQAPDFVNLTAFTPTLALKHWQMFNEVLDVQELVRNPKLGKDIVGQPGRVFSLPDAYQEKYGERIATKQKEAEDQRIEAKVQERLKEERAKSVGQPFPLRGEASPSVLDVLATKDGSAVHTLDTAVAEYERLQAARAGQ